MRIASGKETRFSPPPSPSPRHEIFGALAAYRQAFWGVGLFSAVINLLMLLAWLQLRYYAGTLDEQTLRQLAAYFG